MCYKTGVNDLSLEIKYSDWLSRSGDMSQNRVIDLLLVSRLRLLILFLSLIWVRRDNEFAFLILLLVLFSLSYFLKFDVREWIVHCFQQ